MRLLNTETRRVEYFPDPEIPDYAILSHTWQGIEVSFQELQDPPDDLKELTGYKKVDGCCEQAASVGFSYVWIDTCCIDKTNRVELSDALNSMFHWYRNAQVCYVYMFDVPSSENPRRENSSFRKSRWFTRGWTLQELLAPLHVTFFDDDWNEIGTKVSLQDVISEVTGISSGVFTLSYHGEISVAQRMAWASQRETAEVEDKAYCLMGLLGVNIPMIYGEGEKAFQRLLLEILKTSNDHSIFTWTGADVNEERGLLARSPAEFVNSGDVGRYGDDTPGNLSSVTKRGLHIKLPLIPCPNYPGQNVFLAALNCQRTRDGWTDDRPPLGIFLKRVDGDESKNFIRVEPDRLEEINHEVDFEEKLDVYVDLEDLSGVDLKQMEDDTDFKEKSELSTGGESPSKFDVTKWFRQEAKYIFSVTRRPGGIPRVDQTSDTKHKWEVSEEEIRLTFSASGCSGLMMFKDKGGQMFVVCLGVHNYNVWCDIATDCEGDNCHTIAMRWWDGEGMSARWNYLDRRTASVPGGEKLLLTMKKGIIEGQRGYVVEISIDGEFWLEKVGPACCFYDGW